MLRRRTWQGRDCQGGLIPSGFVIEAGNLGAKVDETTPVYHLMSSKAPGRVTVGKAGIFTIVPTGMSTDNAR